MIFGDISVEAGQIFLLDGILTKTVTHSNSMEGAIHGILRA